MTNSSPAKKVVLNASRDIPFNKLVLSQTNVRKIKAGVSVEELAQDISRRGLLQSLYVRPVVDGEGKETGQFEVPAGGRRFQALQLLVKQKRLSKTAPVPCVVQERHETAAEEDSLAENVQRAPLHPLDQFRAFQKLREERGMSDEEIAAAFFVTPAVVKQRLKLVSVSPKLLDIYAEDAMTLEQLMAFTVTHDHARQEQVWEAIAKGYNKEPYLIRRMLTEGKVNGADRRAVFVGAEAYEAAGGVISRDLFHQDAGGWFEDTALLERLVDEKLQALSANVMSEGWKWVEVARDFPYGHTIGLRRLAPVQDGLDEQTQDELDALYAEQEQIGAEYADDSEDLPEHVDRRLAEIEQAIAKLEDRPERYESDEIARAGVFISLSHEGRARIERGFLRPEDEPKVLDEGGDLDSGDPSASKALAEGADLPDSPVPQANAPETASEEDEGDAMRPLSERLVTELTAHRTLALRAALADDPGTAFIAVLHALCLRAFYGQASYDPASCLEIDSKSAPLSQGGPDLNNTPAAESLSKLHEQWASHLPGEPAELWVWLFALDRDSRDALFAYCAARTVNAVHEPWQRRARAIAHAAQLATTLQLDIATQWAPTRDNYLGRVTKAHILEAVREAKGEAAAQLIDHLKKGEMADEAERLLAGSGWLPKILRTPGLEARDAFDAERSHEEQDEEAHPAGAVELPAFLADYADPVASNGVYAEAAE